MGRKVLMSPRMTWPEVCCSDRFRGRWVALDMHLFGIPSAITRDAGSNAAALAEVEALAERYWRGEQSDAPFVEVLAEKLWLYTAFITDAGLPLQYSQWHASGRSGHDPSSV